MKLNELIKIDNRFEKAVNLLLDLNSKSKIEGYIPTRSSVHILCNYLKETQNYSGNRATILIGPYGKGKSHLLLVLLSLLRKQNYPEINSLIQRIKIVDDSAADILDKTLHDKAPLLPVIINTTNLSLDHAFIRSLTSALHRDGLDDVIPDTIYSSALKAIENWKTNYPGTYNAFKSSCKAISFEQLLSGLQHYNYEAYSEFRALYPTLTSGAQFNPDIDDEVIPVYRSVNRKLREQHGYKGIYIVFDEFSKYIEGHPEVGFSHDMKTLQDICELANSSGDEQLHITCVAHKSIKAYGSTLPKSVLNAFEGVEGRLREVFFTVSSKNNYELIADAISKTKYFDEWASSNRNYQETTDASLELSNFKTLFTENDFRTIVAKGCFPLTPAAAMLLLELSEKIAQNERTIFTFLTSKEHTGLERIVKHAPDDAYIGADAIYDYFLPLFEEDNNTEIHHIWLKADFALSKTDNCDSQAIIKAIAIIGMTNKPDEFPANQELLRLSLGMESTRFVTALNRLIDEKLICYKTRTKSYEYKNNIGIDLETEIADCIRKHFLKPDLCSELDHINQHHFIAPKKHNQTYCITRFFNYKFMTAQQFLKLKERSFIKFNSVPDGIITLILPGEFAEEELIQHLESLQDPCILLMLPSSGFTFEDSIKKLLAARYLRTDSVFIENNLVLARELDDLSNELIEEINRKIKDCYFRTNTVYTAFGPINAKEQGLNRVISDLCDKVYHCTPTINHELINRNSLSPAMNKVQAILLNSMLKGINLFDEYSDTTSAEATVYRATLLKATTLTQITPEFAKVGKIIDEFISSCINTKQKFSILVDRLTSAPYGMRKGPLPILFADHLLRLSDMPVFYFNTKEVTLDAEIIINAFKKPSEYYLYVEEETIQKSTYITALETLFSAYEIYCNEIDRRNKLAKIACLMQSWYRALPQIAIMFNEPDLGTDNIQEIIAFRNLFSEFYLNPRDIIFEKIPMVFGTKNYPEIIERIAIIKEKIESHIEHVKKRLIRILRAELQFSPDDNLARCLNDWYESLSDTAKNAILSSKATAFRRYASIVNSNDEFEICGKIAKYLTGMYIEDWKPTSEIAFPTELTSVLHEIREKSDSALEEIELVDGDKSIKKYYKNTNGKLSTSGHFFKNALDDLLDEYGAKVTNEEKVSILMNLIQEMID